MDKSHPPVRSAPAAATCCVVAPRASRPARYDVAHYQRRAAVLKALAHPVRLFIVDRLESRPHCVCEFTALVGLDQSTVSKHLSVLRSAGIVGDEKRGREIWYSLTIPCVAGFFSCIETALKTGGARRSDGVAARRGGAAAGARGGRR